MKAEPNYSHQLVVYWMTCLSYVERSIGIYQYGISLASVRYRMTDQRWSFHCITNIDFAIWVRNLVTGGK